MPRRNYTRGRRIRDAIARRTAERELKRLAQELRAKWRRTPGPEQPDDDAEHERK